LKTVDQNSKSKARPMLVEWLLLGVKKSLVRVRKTSGKGDDTTLIENPELTTNLTRRMIALASKIAV